MTAQEMSEADLIEYFFCMLEVEPGEILSSDVQQPAA